MGSSDDSQPQAESKYITKADCCRTTTGGCFRFFITFFIESFCFSDIDPVPSFSHSPKPFVWIDALTAKDRIKIIDQILGYISFCFESRAHLSHLFALTPKTIKFNR